MTHSHGREGGPGALWRAVAVPAVLLLVEAVGGILGGSLALLSDAGHQATDIFAAGLAIFAERKGQQPATSSQSYGFHRAGILVAAVNAIVLLVVAALIIWGAIHRFGHPAAVSPDVMGGAALIGIALDAWVVVGLWRHGEDLNRRAILWHVLSDSISAVGILIAAVVIALTGWSVIDPILSLAIAAFIASGAVSILMRAVRVLMEAVPAGVSPDEVRAAILAESPVKAVHDLHIWALAPGRVMLTCHLYVDEMGVGEGQELIERLCRALRTRYGIEHATMQLESNDECHVVENCDAQLPPSGARQVP